METILQFQEFLQGSKMMLGIYFFILGMCIASFLNVVIFRLPKIYEREEAEAVKEWLEERKETFPTSLNGLLNKITLSLPRSHCYSCKTPLKWYHNIPVLSYLFLRGKCGFCGTHISIQYPLVELFGGLLLLASYLTFIDHGLFTFLIMSTFIFMCYAMFGVDWKIYILPDSLTLGALWLGIVAALFGVGLNGITLEQSIKGAIAGYLICWVIGGIGRIVKGQEALGGGDYKFMAAAGAFVGITGAFFTFFIGAIVGIIIFAIRQLMNIKEKKSKPVTHTHTEACADNCKEHTDEDEGSIQTPFGPALIITLFIWIFFKNEILNYLPLPIF